MLKYYESDTYLLDSYPAAVMFDSGATLSFVSRYLFFRFSHIHSFVPRTFALCREIGRPMVTEITVNRMIYVTDVYQVTLLFF